MKLDMVRAHFKYLSVHVFITQVDSASFKDARIKPLLRDLAAIYALSQLKEDSGAVFASGFFYQDAHKNISLALDYLIAKIRPQLIPLAESTYSSDNYFPSSIGNYYGDIYETQLDWAMNSRQNKEDKDGVPVYFEQLIKPFLHGKL